MSISKPSHLFTVLLLILLTAEGFTQSNYYVALVRGEVFYQDSLLRPRTKLKLDDELRFTAAEDYVRLIGPHGMHRVGPSENEEGGFEFIRALTQELFPPVAAISSTSATITAMEEVVDLEVPGTLTEFGWMVAQEPTDYLDLITKSDDPYGMERDMLFGERGVSLRMFAQNATERPTYERRRRSGWERGTYPPPGDATRLVYLGHRFDSGFDRRPVTLRDGELWLTRNDLIDSIRNEPYPEALLVHVYDAAAMDTLLARANYYDQLSDYLEFLSGTTPVAARRTFSPELPIARPDLAPELYRPRAPGIVLGRIQPRAMVPLDQIMAYVKNYQQDLALSEDTFYSERRTSELKTLLEDQFGPVNTLMIQRIYREQLADLGDW